VIKKPRFLMRANNNNDVSIRMQKFNGCRDAWLTNIDKRLHGLRGEKDTAPSLLSLYYNS